MRWMLPAMALSLGVHAALLGELGDPDADVPGSDAMVTGTVIVFDTPPAPAVSAADGNDQEEASSAAGSVTPAYGPKDPLAPPPEQVAEDQPEPPLEPGPEAATQAVTTAEPEPQPESESESEPEATVEDAEESATPVATDTVPLPRPKPPLPEAVAERLAAEKAEAEAEANAKAEARRRAAAEKTKAAEKRRQQAERAAAGNKKKPARAAKATKANKPSSASRQGSAGRSGGASAGEKRAYASRVLSHIQRFKRYPSGTSASGVVRLAVRISGSGSISGASVRKSSGNAVLDRAAIATARAAAPYPAPPGGTAFSFTVSLRYTR